MLPQHANTTKPSWRYIQQKKYYTTSHYTTGKEKLACLHTRIADTILRHWFAVTRKVQDNTRDARGADELIHTSDQRLHTRSADIIVSHQGGDHTMEGLWQTNHVSAIHLCDFMQCDLRVHLILRTCPLHDVRRVNIPFKASGTLSIREPGGIPPPILRILYDNTRSN